MTARKRLPSDVYKLLNNNLSFKSALWDLQFFHCGRFIMCACQIRYLQLIGDIEKIKYCEIAFRSCCRNCECDITSTYHNNTGERPPISNTAIS